MRISAIRGVAVLSLIFTFLLVAVEPTPAATMTTGVTTGAAESDKMKADELVAKHLESLGTHAARAAVRTRLMAGTSTATFRVKGLSQAQGTAVIASDGVRNMLGMKFDTTEYPAEKIGFDGKTVTANYQRPGQYSVLANFLLGNPMVSKEGLLGGSLSGAWPLLDLKEKNPRLNYAGTAKVDDRRLHKLEYLPRGGSDLSVTLFFDSENFRHVRTEYRMQVTAQMGRTPELSARQGQSRYLMVEEFSDFKPEQGLTLPHTYKLRLKITTQSTSFDADWVAQFSQFIFNGNIDAKEFNVAG